MQSNAGKQRSRQIPSGQLVEVGDRVLMANEGEKG